MENIREQFPIFSNVEDLVYLDNAATSQKPKKVIDSVNSFYTSYNSNVHRGLYSIAEKATNKYVDAHVKVAKFINADMKEVFFTRGSSEGLNFIARSLSNQYLEEGDVVVLTELEHHSNIIPWQLAAKKKNVKIEWLPVVGDDLELDLEYLDFLIRKYRDKVKVISFTHVSNVTGGTTDIKSLVAMAKTVGAKTVLDAAQSVPHLKIDVKDLDIDMMVFSGHKMYGPTGIGVVYGKKDILEATEPWHGGGEMVTKVWKTGAEWEDLPWKFEAGTPNIAGGIGLASAVSWMKKNLDMKEVAIHEKTLTRALLEGLRNINGLKILGPESINGGRSIVSFTHSSIHPHDIASMLDEYSIAVRAGFHCAEPLHKKMEFGPTLRVSFGVYNTEQEVEYFLESLEKVTKEF